MTQQQREFAADKQLCFRVMIFLQCLTYQGLKHLLMVENFGFKTF